MEKWAQLGSMKSRLEGISPEHDPKRKGKYVWKHINTSWARAAAVLALGELSEPLSANFAKDPTTSALDMCSFVKHSQ